MFNIAERIAERITVASGGRIECEAFPSGAIVPAGQEYQGVESGVLAAAISGHMNQMNVFPAAGVFYQVVGGLTAVQKMLWLYGGGGDEIIGEMYATKSPVYVTTVQIHPCEIWAHSKVPLNTLSDIQGLKMRATGDAGEIIARIGAAQVNMPGVEIYEAAARGVVDAFEYGWPDLDWTMGFHEITDYVYLSPTRGPTGGCGFFVSEKEWDAIGADQQMMVRQVAQGQVAEWYAEAIALDANALYRYIDYGNEVQALPKEIEDTFVNEANKFYDERAAADPFYARALQSQRDWKALCELQGIS